MPADMYCCGWSEVRFDYAESVAFGIGENLVVSRGSSLPAHLGGSETDESPHLIHLIVGAEIKVDAGRELRIGSHRVE